MRIGPLGIWELLIILVVVLLIFGPRRLPEMAKGIGQSVREFRKGIKDMKDDFEEGAAPAKAETTRAEASPPVVPEPAPTSVRTEPAEAAPAASPVTEAEDDAARARAKADA